jgi:hypothetical protein
MRVSRVLQGKKMDDYNLWLDQKIGDKKQEIAALLKAPETEQSMRRISQLQDQLSDLRWALTTYLDYQREVLNAKSTR